MTDIRLQKLKASLTDAIQKWVNEESETFDNWCALDTCVSDFTTELMADSAFNILMAQSDLTEYLKKQGHIEE
jgi:hypothetical protein